MSSPGARPPAWLGVLGVAVGVASIGWGLWLDRARPPAAPAVAPEEAAAPRTPVRAGSGTWTAEAPDAGAEFAPTAVCPGCDVVVITVCSLRLDRVGAYTGGTLTPSIDSIATGGYRFDRAYAASNFTLAGLTALLTGRFGSTTGVTGWDKGLVADVPTLPEVLGHYGYATGGFTVDAPSGFRPDYGLDRGFQHLELIPPPRDTSDGRFVSGEVGPGGASAGPAARWIAAQPTDRPLFAMFHSRTAHFPFVITDDVEDPTGVSKLLWEAGGVRAAPPGAAGGSMPGTAGGTARRGVVALSGKDPLQSAIERVGEPGVVAWRARYDEAVARMDRDVAVVLDAIRARGRYDRTVVLLVADHGESLNDHGELLHGDAYWDGVVHVPLLMRVPGLGAGEVPGLVSHVDVAPTLLELVGAVAPAGIDGASMVPLLTGRLEAIRSTALIEGGVSFRDSPIPRGAVIAPPWALLRQDRGCGAGGREPPRAPDEPATCLYDLDADPGQTRNVAVGHPDVVAALLDRWDRFREARAGAASTERLELDPAFVEELRRNGYDFDAGRR